MLEHTEYKFMQDRFKDPALDRLVPELNKLYPLEHRQPWDLVMVVSLMIWDRERRSAKRPKVTPAMYRRKHDRSVHGGTLPVHQCEFHGGDVCELEGELLCRRCRAIMSGEV